MKDFGFINFMGEGKMKFSDAIYPFPIKLFDGFTQEEIFELMNTMKPKQLREGMMIVAYMLKKKENDRRTNID